MTEQEYRISELIVAVGYALDAGNDKKSSENRADCREKAERILRRIIKLEQEKSDVKPVHIETNVLIIKPAF